MNLAKREFEVEGRRKKKKGGSRSPVNSGTRNLWPREGSGHAWKPGATWRREPEGTFCLRNQTWDAARMGLARGFFRKSNLLLSLAPSLHAPLSCWSLTLCGAEAIPADQHPGPLTMEGTPLLWTRKDALVRHDSVFRTWARFGLFP